MCYIRCYYCAPNYYIYHETKLHKKGLLRVGKRCTDRSVANPWLALSGGGCGCVQHPVQSCRGEGADAPSIPAGGGGTPSSPGKEGTLSSPGQSNTLPPIQTWSGYPPPIYTWLGYPHPDLARVPPGRDMGPVEILRDGDGVPPQKGHGTDQWKYYGMEMGYPVNRQMPVKT